MYAILQHGGHQYRVASGDRILVDRIPVEVGSTVTLESVLLIGDGAETDVAKGSPVEASVTATVIAHRRGRKIRVFTYKPKKRHRRTLGYRSQLTELRIDEVARGKADGKAEGCGQAPKRCRRSRRPPPSTESEPRQLQRPPKPRPSSGPSRRGSRPPRPRRRRRAAGEERWRRGRGDRDRGSRRQRSRPLQSAQGHPSQEGTGDGA